MYIYELQLVIFFDPNFNLYIITIYRLYGTSISDNEYRTWDTVSKVLVHLFYYLSNPEG